MFGDGNTYGLHAGAARRGRRVASDEGCGGGKERARKRDDGENVKEHLGVEYWSGVLDTIALSGAVLYKFTRERTGLGSRLTIARGSSSNQSTPQTINSNYRLQARSRMGLTNT